MTENAINNASDIRLAIANIAAEYGVDLNAYGNASPTKIFMESLIAATDNIKAQTLVALTEQNPYTAVTLKSLLGLASLAGYNVTKYMQASRGRVLINPGDKPLIVTNRTAMQTEDNFMYYIDMPHDTLTITEPTLFDVFQGTVKSQVATASGERHETFLLRDEDLIDPQSVSVIVDNRKRTIGLNIFDRTDFFMSLNSRGDVIIVPAQLRLTEGTNVKITYASCYGYPGDKPTIGIIMDSPALTSLNPENKDFEIEISVPIIGGTAKPILADDLDQMLLGSSVTNLIGNVDQLQTYLTRYRRYIMHVSARLNYVLTVAVCRNLRVLVNDDEYWTAVQYVEMNQGDAQDMAEFASLRMQLARLPDLQLSNIINYVPAKIQYAAVQLEVKMSVTNQDLIRNAVAEYALEWLDNRMYENADLYTKINELPTVSECKCRLISSHVNEYGNVYPQTKEHVVIINALYMTINGEQFVVNNMPSNGFEYTLNFQIVEE